MQPGTVGATAHLEDIQLDCSGCGALLVLLQAGLRLHVLLLEACQGVLGACVLLLQPAVALRQAVVLLLQAAEDAAGSTGRLRAGCELGVQLLASLQALLSQSSSARWRQPAQARALHARSPVSQLCCCWATPAQLLGRHQQGS